MELSTIFINGKGIMKTYFLITILFITTQAFSSESSEISCEIKRDEWVKSVFHFEFKEKRKAQVKFEFQTQTGESGNRPLLVSNIHLSREAKYVGLNFLNQEKLVFILLETIFNPENTGITTIEVVSSIYGPINATCHQTK